MPNQVARAAAPQFTLDSRFNLPTKNFGNQFASIYWNRLLSLRLALVESINQSKKQNKQSEFPVITRLLDVPINQRCAIIGTVYKHQKLKPSILAEYSAQKKGDFPASVSHTLDSTMCADSTKGVNTNGKYTSDDDTCVLEDDTGRIALIFKQSDDDDIEMSDQSSNQSNGRSTNQSMIHKIVTGAVIGCVGVADALGKFVVESVIPPGFAPQAPRTISKQPRYMVAVSGLLIGHPLADPLPRQLLADWLIGFVDSEAAPLIDCLLILGNSLNRVGKKRSRDGLKEELDVAALSSPVHELDNFIDRVASSMSVILLPGVTDPSNFTLPQNPLHACLTPKANNHPQSFTSLTNPAILSRTVDDQQLDMVLSAGQNVTDSRELTRDQSSCDIMEKMVNWRHICPSCPDTLPGYPFTESDPFVLENSPHLMITGNQPSFETRFIESGKSSCRLISLPEFHVSPQVALIRLDDQQLSVQTVEFDVGK